MQIKSVNKERGKKVLLVEFKLGIEEWTKFLVFTGSDWMPPELFDADAVVLELEVFVVVIGAALDTKKSPFWRPVILFDLKNNSLSSPS